MHFWKVGYVLTGVLVLSACTISMPKYQQTKNILLPPSITPSVSNSLESPYFSIGPWPQEDWWTMFNSPQLNDMICTALAFNPTLQEAKRRVEAVRQESIVIRSQLFPLVFFQAEDVEQYLSQNGLYRALNPKIPLDATLVDLTLNFKYEFDFWGKNANLFRAAIGRTLAERAEAMQVRLIITTAIAQGYFALKANLIRKCLFEELFDVRSEEVQLSHVLQNSALSSKLEPLIYEENLLAAKQFLDAINAEIAFDKHLINILMGRSPDACLEIDAILPPLPATISIPCNVSSGLLARRPDLMAQIWRAKALAHEVGAAIANFYPDVNLAAFIGLESISFKTLFQGGSFTAAMNPSIYLPIFTAGAIQANVCANKALFDAAIFSYNELLLMSAQEVADLLYLAKSVYQQKYEQDLILESAKKRYNLVDVLRQTGLGNKLDVYAILENVIQKELDDVTLIYTQYLVSVKLIKALGGGYCPQYVPLRAWD